MKFMKKSSKTIYVVIVSYNGGKKIVECLESLKQADAPKDWQIKILVVDNGSTDNTVRNVKRRVTPLRSETSELRWGHAGLRVIENGKNLGFAAGCNIGIKEALEKNARAVILLNQDTVVEKDFLVALLESKADIVGPVIKFLRQGKWRYDFGGRVNKCIGKTEHVVSASYSASRLASYELDYVSGCAMMVKRPVFEEIGLFDEKFFLYFEDTDFCLRAKKTGFKIAVEPRSTVYHKLTDPQQRSMLQNRHLIKSHLFFINKHMSCMAKPLAYAYWLLVSVKILSRLG